jgi:hypothetical protein
MQVNTPSLAELRSSKYTKRANHSLSGITHGRFWETSTPIHRKKCNGCNESCRRNRQHTLRISAEFAKALKSMPGRKKRYSSRVPGRTPDESYVQAGQRANGLPHQLRRRMCLLVNLSDDRIQQLLEENPEYKPEKGRVSVVMLMPSLEEAIDDLYHIMLKRNPKLRFHPVFKRRWAPAVCRLIELHWFIGAEN